MTVLKMGEFINIAVKDEEFGEAFYRSMAGKAKNEKVREGFTRIAQDEIRHAKRFREMLNEVGAQKPFEQYAGQYENYVNALLDSRATGEATKVTSLSAEIQSDSAALDMAMKMEKDTLLFYFELTNFIPATHKKYVTDIIEEEKNHLRDFDELKKLVSK